MKEDAPPPKRPPRKNRPLERAPDHWLAVWANDPELPEAERERVQAVRDQRKQAKPDLDLGILIDDAGITPEQLETISSLLRRSQCTAIHHPWASHALHTACRATGARITVHRPPGDLRTALRQVVLNSMTVIVAPRSATDIRAPAWDTMRYAKHRSLPVTLVLPDGTIPT